MRANEQTDTVICDYSLEPVRLMSGECPGGGRYWKAKQSLVRVGQNPECGHEPDAVSVHVTYYTDPSLDGPCGERPYVGRDAVTDRMGSAFHIVCGGWGWDRGPNGGVVFSFAGGRVEYLVRVDGAPADGPQVVEAMRRRCDEAALAAFRAATPDTPARAKR